MESKRFLTSAETAVYLDIPLHTLYTLTSQLKLTYYRCGKRCYFDIADIYKYITRNKVPAGSRKKGIHGKRGCGNPQGQATESLLIKNIKL